MADVLDIDHGWNRIKRDLKDLDNSYTKVGVMENTTHQSADGELSDLVQIAAANEFGTTNDAGEEVIPARSAFKQAFDNNIIAITRTQNVLFSRVVTNVISVRQGLAMLGEFLTSKTKKAIRDLKSPPNAASTIKKKNSANPLVDQGQLVQSITHTEFVG